MAIEKDFLMRQLAMMFELISKIVRYRKDGEKEKAWDEIVYFYQNLRIDSDIKMMRIDELLTFLQKDKNLSNEHLEMVAFVLKEQGELEETLQSKLDFFRKSYFLLRKVDRESSTFSMERQMKLADLEARLN